MKKRSARSLVRPPARVRTPAEVGEQEKASRKERRTFSRTHGVPWIGVKVADIKKVALPRKIRRQIGVMYKRQAADYARGLWVVGLGKAIRRFVLGSGPRGIVPVKVEPDYVGYDWKDEQTICTPWLAFDGKNTERLLAKMKERDSVEL